MNWYEIAELSQSLMVFRTAMYVEIFKDKIKDYQEKKMLLYVDKNVEYPEELNLMDRRDVEQMHNESIEESYEVTKDMEEEYAYLMRSCLNLGML
jgi:hypothetical protein